MSGHLASANHYRKQAAHYRQLASETQIEHYRDMLLTLAAKFERAAAMVEKAEADAPGTDSA